MFEEIVVANKNYAAVAVKQPQNLDKTAIKVIRHDCPPFLLPLRLVNIDNQIQLRYEISGGIRLSYIPLKMRKKDLNQLLNCMIMPFMDCADWFLDYHNIYLDRNYIMVDQNDYKVKHVYMPFRINRDSKTNTEEDILKFFGELVMEIELEDDPAYTTSVMRCIIGREASLRTLSDMLKRQSQNTELEVKEQPIIMSVASKKSNSSAQEKKQQPEDEKRSFSLAGQKYGDNNLVGAIGAKLFDDDNSAKKKNKKEDKKENKYEKDKKSKGFWGKLLEGDKKAKSEYSCEEEGFKPVVGELPDINSYRQQPSESKEYEEFGENLNTEIEYEEEYCNTDVLRMRLERSAVNSVPELIELDMSKGCVVVGRYDKTGRMSADVNFDMSLTFIGRRHARFEKTGDDFFVIDLESKNHTYLNKEELLPNRRYKLHKGDCITFTKKYGITYQIC